MLNPNWCFGCNECEKQVSVDARQELQKQDNYI